MAPQPQGESDPLAELARLIGQADPFSSFAGDAQARQAQREPGRASTTPSPSLMLPNPLRLSLTPTSRRSRLPAVRHGFRI